MQYDPSFVTSRQLACFDNILAFEDEYLRTSENALNERDVARARRLLAAGVIHELPASVLMKLRASIGAFDQTEIVRLRLEAHQKVAAGARDSTPKP